MSVTGAGESETVYAYHPNNWLLTETRTEDGETKITHYRYDANGGEVWRQRENFAPKDGRPRGRVEFAANGASDRLAKLEIRTYNGFGELVEIYSDGQKFSYAYRPDGLRYKKLVKAANGAVESAKTHLWDGQNMVAEVGVNGQIAARYLRGANLIAREVDGTLEYYLFNAHGDVVQRVHESGETAKSYRYDAFGVEENPEPLDANPFRYCGEYFDGETGEVYQRSRYYNPGCGRFTCEDPAKDGGNWYAYAGQNPVRFTDPDGRQKVEYDMAPYAQKEFRRQIITYLETLFSAENWKEFGKQKVSEISQESGIDLQKIIDQQAVIKAAYEFPDSNKDSRMFYADGSILDWESGFKLIKGSAGVGEYKIDGNKKGWYFTVGATKATANVSAKGAYGDLTLIYYKIGYSDGKWDYALDINLGGVGGGYDYSLDEWEVGATYVAGFKLSGKKVSKQEKKK